MRGDEGTARDIYELTPATRRLYNAMIDPENFSLSVTDLCAKANISRNTYYRRMSEPEFVDMIKEEQRSQVEEKIGNVLMATYRYAMEEGGHQDRKMLLKWAGEFTEKSETKIEGGVDIGRTSAILQKYLRDEVEDEEDEKVIELR